MKKLLLTAIFLSPILLIGLNPPLQASPPAKSKKILFIDSYNKGNAWSDGIRKGVKQKLKDTATELKIHYMDTKRNRSESFKQSAALKAKQVIADYAPDVVIAADDNASKYLIAPFFKNEKLPIVFCGLNWDANLYGFPTENITGMVEVEIIHPLLKQLETYAKGKKIGIVTTDSTTARKKVRYGLSDLSINYHKTYFVNSYKEYKKRYLQLQSEVDILLLGNQEGLVGWDGQDFKRFVRENTSIPTGATSPWLKDYALMAYVKIPEEQGEWAAETALRILEGAPPSSIPPVKNKKGKLFLNMRLAEVLNVTFSPATVKRGDLLWPYEGKKVLHIDSYHTGYQWSDGIRKGIEGELKNTGAKLISHYMDTKRNSSEPFKIQAANEAMSLIEKVQPDIVIASDDNASKYLVQKHLKNAKLPVVFCGINWNASEYGYPYENTTGMIEVDFISTMVKQLKRYSKGNRMGILSVNRLSEKKIIRHLEEAQGLKVHQKQLVETFEEWKNAYLKLQTETDFMVFMNHTGISGWDDAEALEFVDRHIAIPSGAYDKAWMPFNPLGYIKSPVEQGQWAAKTALEILDGKSPREIPITTNKEQTIMLNPRLVKKLGLVVDRAFYRRAEIVK